MLGRIHDAPDLRRLSIRELHALADAIRERLIDACSRTGGYIGAGLGVVEPSVALYAVFETPRDQLVWDVGHQGYPHTVLTGRNDRLEARRQEGGLSGFLTRTESAHDAFGAGRAATSISAALGIAAGRDLQGEDHEVVAAIGDGSLTSGLAYEALNSAGHSDRDLIVVLNDNELSIAPNVGAMAMHLTQVQRHPIYNRIRARIGEFVESHDALNSLVRTWEESLKSLLTPGVPFEELGFRYVGPIDGHDRTALMETFTAVRPMSGPHLVHVVTRKGHGCPAGDHVEKWHALPPGDDPATGRVRATSPAKPGWTAVFGRGLAELMHEREAVVAITAAMPTGTGTSMVAAAHPSRFFDVGIAESHAVTLAAGLAMRALHPVVAIYSTFLQRAYDNVIHDVALQRLPVMFAPDRAGLVGEDGETHMRLYGIAYLPAVPRLVVTAPKDGREMLGVLESALAHDAAFSLRYPRDGSPDVVSAMAAVPPGAVRDVGGAAAGRRGGGARGGDDGDDGPRGGRDAGGRGARRHGGELPIPEAVRRGHAPRAVRPSSLAPVVEEGTVTNGFGAMLAAVVHRDAPNVRPVSHGCPTGSSARPRARGNSPRPGWMGRGSRSGSGPFTRARQLPGEGAIVGG